MKNIVILHRFVKTHLMIKSMTGFGKAECDLPNKKVSIEIKSLNSKQLDIHSKIPGLYKEKDLEIRNLLSKRLERGKLEVYISYEVHGTETTGEINKEVFKHYFKQFQELKGDLQFSDQEAIVSTIMRMPDVLKIEKPELSKDEWVGISQGIVRAIEALDGFRIDEGKSLENDLSLRCNNISKLLIDVDQFLGNRIDRVKKRLMANLDELQMNGSVDENRFEQELIYYLEKLDITEEKVRLKNHCEYFLKTMEETGAHGKKLGFIAQEMGREINTLGSKANDADIQKIVIVMKDELEKIKEQVLNVL